MLCVVTAVRVEGWKYRHEMSKLGGKSMFSLITFIMWEVVAVVMNFISSMNFSGDPEVKECQLGCSWFVECQYKSASSRQRLK